jgi:hypothetical protein
MESPPAMRAMACATAIASAKLTQSVSSSVLLTRRYRS